MSVADVRTRERKRIAWVAVERTTNVALWMFISVYLAAIPTALVLAANGSNPHFLLPVVAVFTVSMLGAILTPTLRKKVTTQAERYIDPRFASRAYPMVIRSLRGMKVADPAVFIDEHPAFGDSYRAVKRAALNVLDSYYSQLDGSRVTANRIHDEAHRIAMLVFPGQDRIAREQRIIYFLETRGIADYGTLVEMLGESDSQPLPLLEGVL